MTNKKSPERPSEFIDERAEVVMNTSDKLRKLRQQVEQSLEGRVAS